MVGNYILEKGRPRLCMRITEWIVWMENNNPIVERTKVANGCEVVTAFTGTDLGEGFPDPPMLWETSLRTPKDRFYHNDEYCYTSLGAAKQGHFEIVKALEDQTK